MKNICICLINFLILTVVLGLDPYSESIGHVPEPEVARRCINLAAFIARLRVAHLCRLDHLFYIQVLKGLADTHSSPSALPLLSAAVRPSSKPEMHPPRKRSGCRKKTLITRHLNGHPNMEISYSTNLVQLRLRIRQARPAEGLQSPPRPPLTHPSLLKKLLKKNEYSYVQVC